MTIKTPKLSFSFNFSLGFVNREEVPGKGKCSLPTGEVLVKTKVLKIN
jgi:hypothetical protein